MSSTIIETSGYIVKEVNLKSLSERVIPKTCVLMALGLYPGYYGEDLSFPFPESIFILLHEHYSKEKIARATKEIKKYIDHAFEAFPGDISLYNNRCRFIRIKGLNDYAQIENMQKCYLDTGLKLKKKMMDIQDKGIVKVEKEFLINEFEQGTYRDSLTFEKHYVEIPAKLNWKLFQKITQNIKNNWDGHSFDAAIGTLFRFAGLQDIVRIYGKEITQEEIQQLKEKYQQEIYRAG